MRAWAARFGLDRRELRAWVLYDWANSAFQATVVAAVFPIYYARVAASGLSDEAATLRFGIATTIALALIAAISPPLGALADAAGRKKALLTAFMTLGAGACAAMVCIGTGQWMLALALFMLANIGAAGSLTFYDSLLPHIARPDELDRVSSAGYAIGYLGSGMLLAANLWWIQQPSLFGFADAGAATRASFLSVGIWWALFTIPLLRHVPEPAVATVATPWREAFSRLRETHLELRRYPQAFLMLVAFLLYNDGIGTFIRMASLYGTQIGIDQGSLITALLLVQFIGIPFAVLFGWVAERVGAKNAIFAALAIYTCTAILAFWMTTATHFFLLAALVGTVQGGSQALSRSLFASLIPRERSSEFFGFFAVFEKFAGIFGPLFFSAAVGLTGSNRTAILSVILFFVAGGLVLVRVDVAAGQRQAVRGAHAD